MWISDEVFIQFLNLFGDVNLKDLVHLTILIFSPLDVFAHLTLCYRSILVTMQSSCHFIPYSILNALCSKYVEICDR